MLFRGEEILTQYNRTVVATKISNLAAHKPRRNIAWNATMWELSEAKFTSITSKSWMCLPGMTARSWHSSVQYIVCLQPSLVQAAALWGSHTATFYHPPRHTRGVRGLSVLFFEKSNLYIATLKSTNVHFHQITNNMCTLRYTKHLISRFLPISLFKKCKCHHKK